MFFLEVKSKVFLVPMVFFDVSFEWRFEEVRWHDLLSQDRQGEDLFKGGILGREDFFFFLRGNIFSKNKLRWNLLFGLKEEWECVIDASAEVTRAKVSFLKDKRLKEEDGHFEEVDLVTTFEASFASFASFGLLKVGSFLK